MDTFHSIIIGLMKRNTFEPLGKQTRSRVSQDGLLRTSFDESSHNDYTLISLLKRQMDSGW